MERAAIPEKDRSDFYLYVDEFQNVVTQTFENILSEARKYGLNLTIAHQYVGQIISKVHQAVLGNVGSIICFRVGGEDAVKLKPEFDPIFGVKDMINLAVGEIYVKMTIDGESYDPFSAETLKVLPPTHASLRNEIIAASRRKYTISKDAAAQLIAQEEASIIRSAEEKAIIEGKNKKNKSVEKQGKIKDIEEEHENLHDIKKEDTDEDFDDVEAEDGKEEAEAEPMI
jgi:hypothetical protein